MKRLLYILAIGLFALSCEKGGGNRSDIHILDTIVESTASINDDETYLLSVSFSGEGYYVSLSMNSPAAAINAGNYKIGPDGWKVSLNDGYVDRNITSGNVKISINKGIYTVEISAISRNTEYNFRYEGPLTIDTSITPSENILMVTEGNATYWDQNQWKDVIISGVSKYTIIVMDPEDNTLAYLELIDAPGKKLEHLTGEYSVRSGSTSEGTIVAGSVFWGTASGSFYTVDGKQRYITSGKIKISRTTDNENYYFSLTGSNLSTTTAEGSTASGTMQMKHMMQVRFDGTVIRNCEVNSTAMGRSMKYSIYLPDGYEEGDDYPILYLLHGYGDENNAWIDKGMLLKTAYSYEKKGGKPMIVVCPDGLTEFYLGRWETYMYDELMPLIESTYKFNGKRAVAGLSMGGYGTLYYWSKYPEMYCYAYAMSPAVDVTGTAGILANKDKDILPALTIETGIQDSTTPLAGITEFHNYLVSEGIEHEFITRSGSHDWKFWQECLPKVLNKCGESFE